MSQGMTASKSSMTQGVLSGQAPEKAADPKGNNKTCQTEVRWTSEEVLRQTTTWMKVTTQRPAIRETLMGNLNYAVTLNNKSEELCAQRTQHRERRPSRPV
ncbi:hypothetical protein LSAT2_024126 [Lamellibrachia satsuma]|nr:hypothetical protein LSAT2_024126 [Lamellibrachia satsuma]